MKLESFKPKSALIKPFWFPEGTSEKEGIKVTLQYISPTLRDNVEKGTRIALAQEGRKPDEMAPGDLRREIMNAMILESVKKCEYVTLRKLQSLVELSPEAVAANGGLDAEVPMDPSKGVNHADAQANILYLLNSSEIFSNWALTICRDLSRFQDREWEERLGNSEAGRSATLAPAPVK